MIFRILILILLAAFSSIVYAKYGHDNAREQSENNIDDMIKNNQMDDYVKR